MWPYNTEFTRIFISWDLQMYFIRVIQRKSTERERERCNLQALTSHRCVLCIYIMSGNLLSHFTLKVRRILANDEILVFIIPKTIFTGNAVSGLGRFWALSKARGDPISASVDLYESPTIDGNWIWNLNTTSILLTGCLLVKLKL